MTIAGAPAALLAANEAPYKRQVFKLSGMRICYVSSLQADFDARIFYRQCAPLAAKAAEVWFVGPHVDAHANAKVRMIATAARRNRFIRMLSTILLLPKALRLKAHVYFLNDPELLPMGLMLKFLTGAKVVYDSREDYPKMILTKRYIPKALRPLASFWMSSLECVCAKRFDGIMTADPGTLRRVATLGESKKLVLYNFPSLSLFSPKSVPKLYDFVYRGGISVRAGTHVLLDALCILASEGYSAKTLIIGYADDSSEWDKIAATIDRLGLSESIKLSGRIPHEDMPSTLSQARIGVCPLLAIPKFLRNIPVKVFEYWACGLPVIASDLPPIRPFMRHESAGILVTPGDPQALAQAMKALLDNPERAANMGADGRIAIEKRLNSEGEFRKLLKFLERMQH